MKKIEVVAYNPDWPNQFQELANQIQEALGDHCLTIHHVGSTSVPDLAAKPKIDLIVVVKEPEEVISMLESIGFEYRGAFNIPMHFGFRSRGEVAANLHVYKEGNPEIKLNLMFRDFLRAHPEVRDEYAKLKLDLIAKESSHKKKWIDSYGIQSREK